jgi:hypothetical protein
MLLKLLNCGKSMSVEEYRLALQKRCRLFRVLIMFGIATLLFSLLGVPRLLPAGSRQDFFSGLYCGVGIGLMICGVIFLVKTRAALKSEETLRRARNDAQDERNAAIASRAAGSACLVLWLALYAVVLVAGLFAPVLFFFSIGVIVFFAVSFLCFYIYYSHKL